MGLHQSLCTIFSEGATTKPTKRQSPIHINGCEGGIDVPDFEIADANGSNKGHEFPPNLLPPELLDGTWC